MPAEARTQIDGWADQLSFPLLHRLWQLLLKGHEEVTRSSLPLESCDMALLRVLHGANMPDPGELARMLKDGAPVGAAPSGSPQMAPAASAPVPTVNAMPTDFAALLKLLGSNGHVMLESTLHDVMRVIEFAPPVLVYQLAGPVMPGFDAQLRDALSDVTGARWELELRSGDAPPTLLEREQQAEAEAKREILESPLVKAALAAFPDAEVDFGKIETINDVRSATA